MDKHKRYRIRQARAGRCPHCGKPAFPFYECAERRFARRIKYYLARAVSTGELVRDAEGRYRVGKERRGVTRYRVSAHGQRPRRVFDLLAREGDADLFYELAKVAYPDAEWKRERLWCMTRERLGLEP